MPFSILIQCTPLDDVPVAHVQGANIQAMFLDRIQALDPSLMPRLHDEPGYRPFTLSPLGIAGEKGYFQGFRLPREHLITKKSVCYLRMTLLDDELFPVVCQGFRDTDTTTFVLRDCTFAITDVLTTNDADSIWSFSYSYPDLIDRALQYQRRKNIQFRFLTPTSFRQDNLDLPLPLPRLIFKSYQKRFEAFYQVAFLPDFDQQVAQYVGIAKVRHLNSAVMHTKQIRSLGFTGEVTCLIHPKAPPELGFQVNLLAEYAVFCGTGKKTVLGMGQTLVN
jgi:CRISPR-associated endoribonuclease Cas6